MALQKREFWNKAFPFFYSTDENRQEIGIDGNEFGLKTKSHLIRTPLHQHFVEKIAQNSRIQSSISIIPNFLSDYGRINIQWVGTIELNKINYTY